jgi:hypothetical protein
MQGVDVRSQSWRQLGGELRLELAPFSAHLLSGLDWPTRELAEVEAGLEFVDRRGDSARVDYLYLPSGPDQSPWPLVLAERTQREDGLPAGLAPEAYRALGGGVHALQMIADANLGLGFRLSGGFNLDIDAPALNWYGGGVGYRSDCRCWSFSLTARMLRGQRYPDVFFLLDVATLGSAGGGTSTRF